MRSNFVIIIIIIYDVRSGLAQAQRFQPFPDLDVRQTLGQQAFDRHQCLQVFVRVSAVGSLAPAFRLGPSSRVRQKVGKLV